MQSFTYVIQDPLGIHARPAGKLVKAATEFKCDITLETVKGKADAKRILAVMGLAAKQGTTITVQCVGQDEEQAANQLQKFMESNL